MTKNKTLKFRLSPDDLLKLRTLAGSEGVSVSEFIRRAIRQAAAGNQAQEAAEHESIQK